MTLSIDGGIATIIIDNATRVNALTRSMLATLGDHLNTVAQNTDIAVVVVIGAGGNFCAGLDIADVARRDERRLEDDFAAVEDELALCPKPTIAAIDGHCIGGGTQLAVACDIRIASERATFAITPAKLGLIYPSTSIDRLVRNIGPSATKRLIFTADTITAPSALRYGVVTDIVAATELHDTVRRIASTIARRSPITVAAAKQMTDESATYGSVSHSLHHHWQTTPNPDLTVGLAAFAAGHAPEFRPNAG